MSCSACSAAVEASLRRRAGVRRAHVALTTQEARVEYDALLVKEVRCGCPSGLACFASKYN